MYPHIPTCTQDLENIALTSQVNDGIVHCAHPDGNLNRKNIHLITGLHFLNNTNAKKKLNRN